MLESTSPSVGLEAQSAAIDKVGFPTVLSLDSRLKFTEAVARKWCWLRDVPAFHRDDAIQEAHLAVLQAMRGSYDPARPLLPLLFKAIKYRLCNWYFGKILHLKGKAKLREKCQRYRRTSVMPERSFSGSRTDLCDLLDAAEWLTPRQRQHLELLLDGKTAGEIAEAQGCSHFTAYMNQQAMMHKLKSLLKLGDDD